MDKFDNQPDRHSTPWAHISRSHNSTLTRHQARTMALVLDSRAIPCCIVPDGAGWLLLVPEQHLETAGRELRLHEEANRNWPPALPPARHLIENTLSTLSVLVLLATFHNLTIIGISLPEQGLLNLAELGTAHAESILAGEWWRAVTALTLHGDLMHLLGNLTIGGAFIILLCRELGSGLAWALLLAAGTCGNLLNAWVQSPAHRSVGASTAVFGAVGILTAISMVRYRHNIRQRWFVPVAAGLALLALLGTEGKQTDTGAHLFGFAAGIIFGLATEFLLSRYGRPRPVLNFILGLLSGSLVVTAWWAAVWLG